MPGKLAVSTVFTPAKSLQVKYNNYLMYIYVHILHLLHRRK